MHPPRPSAFHWNRLMRDHVTRGSHQDAILVLHRMQRSGFYPDNFTFPIALKACTSLNQGRQIHAHILTTIGFFHQNLYTSNSLIAMYCKYDRLQDALQLFDEMPHRNTVTWNTIISGLVHNGLAASSFSYFSRMLLSGLAPDSVTICTVLHAHACLGAASIRSGRGVHGYLVRREFRMDERLFSENSLVHMYLESNCVESAKNVFDGMGNRDSITWTTLISGYARLGLGNLAIAAFRLVLLENVKLDPVVLVSVMPAIGFLCLGKEIHCYAVRSCFDDSNAYVGSSLLHMYAALGSVEYAANVFERIRKRNVVVWTTMIMAYAKHGRSEDSLRLFEEMQMRARVTPNHMTFMGVLTACAHAGLVDQARECFKCMTDEYQLIPDMHHYAAMVDVMGRAGQLKEALEFIQAMPVEPSAPVWGALLGSCGVYQDLEMGHEVAEIVMGLEPENPTNYVFLSNMFAGGQRWGDVGTVRDALRRRGLQKEIGSSSVNV